LAKFHATLAPVERERAARFRFERDRNRFMVGRGALREILGHYLQIDPIKVEFIYGPHGKPLLADNGREGGWQFNLAHSDALALVGVTCAGNIGVDIERIRPVNDVDELVARFFCPREIAAFHALPEEQKPIAFFNLWTRKEAWLKATGEGIGHSLNRVEVAFLPGEAARLLSLPEGPHAGDYWTLHQLDPAPGFAAALAVRAADRTLACWRWPENCQ
jgi:4'-phosphopantetheinyl transferase